MRTKQPRPERRDAAPADLPETGASCCFSGRGLCCPDDPLDLVLRLFPTDQAPSSLAALGIGGGAGGGEPPRPKQEPAQPLPESASGGGGGWGSWGFSSSVLDELWSGLDEIDVDMFFADDDALDGGNGGEAATEGNSLCDTAAAKPKPPAHVAAAAGGLVHVHTPGSLGRAVVDVVVPNDASPTPAGALPLQPFDACPALDAAASNNASTPVPVACGGAPPVVVTNNNSTPPLPALITPAPMPAGGPPRVLPAPTGGPPPFFVTNHSAPPLPALIMPAAAAAPAPMPPAASLHACGALPGIVSNGAPAPPPPLMLHPAAGGSNAPAHAPPSAAPSSSPPSRASSGSGRCTSSSATSEPEFSQPHAWVVPRKQRIPPAANRRKRRWVLDFPLHALAPPPVAPPPATNPAGDDDDANANEDAKNQNAAALPVAVAPPGNTGADNDSAVAAAGAGGVRRRRAAPRQRNRQAGQRVCSHCHSPETPQWRAGPDGPGTLCNACGIRYATDRLLPEYRPSTAPSFRSGQHSNRHRKVMKLREQTMIKAKEEEPSPEQAVEDDGAEEKDDGCMGACEYISDAGL